MKSQTERGVKLPSLKIPNREAGGECNESCVKRRGLQMGETK